MKPTLSLLKFTDAQLLKMEDEIVIRLCSLAKSRTHADPVYVRELVRRGCSPENPHYYFFLRDGLRSGVFDTFVQNRVLEGSLSSVIDGEKICPSLI